LRVEDLRGEAADAYRMWRDVFHLSESAALTAVAQDGLITLSEDEKFARSFRETWGLSEAAAETAARGRGGRSAPSSKTGGLWPAAESSSFRPRLGDVIATIWEFAADRGVSLRDAAFEVMRAAPTDQLADYVTRVAEICWPGIWASPGSSGTVHR
jgi:hypothetical protein